MSCNPMFAVSVGRFSPRGVTRRDMHQKGPFSIRMPGDLYRKTMVSIYVGQHMHRAGRNPMSIAGGRHG